eukprot:3104942-Prymnesium_polylepis.1
MFARGWVSATARAASCQLAARAAVPAAAASCSCQLQPEILAASWDPQLQRQLSWQLNRAAHPPQS